MPIPTPHSATRVWREDSTDPGDWGEGEPKETAPTPEASAAFGAFLQLPRGDESGGPGGRKVRRPTLMFPPPPDGTRLTAGDEVDVTAPELLGEGTARFEVVGDPAASGPPGGPVIVFEAALAKVDSKGGT